MYFDLYTGFYDTGRIYSPTMQTFLTPDPAQADPNTYRYDRERPNGRNRSEWADRAADDHAGAEHGLLARCG